MKSSKLINPKSQNDRRIK